MQQRALDPTESTMSSTSAKKDFFAHRKTQWDGAKGAPITRSAKDDRPSQRLQEFSRLWSLGGFNFWTSNYQDVLFDSESNTLAYNFWRDQVRSRIKNPILHPILAPETPPYAFGTKRVPLEQTYYESFNLPHVNLIDISSDPISQVQPTGLTTKSGQTHTFDILILATGFDVSAGASLTQLNISNPSATNNHRPESRSLTLTSKWNQQTSTHLGISTSSFPNLFFPYGPQSPSNTCNGPLCAEIQGTFIIDLLLHMRENGKSRVEATELAEEEWSAHVRGLLEGSLFESTRSYYWGDNVERMDLSLKSVDGEGEGEGEAEGRKRERELVFYFGGVPGYIERLGKVAKEGYTGFVID